MWVTPTTYCNVLEICVNTYTSLLLPHCTKTNIPAHAGTGQPLYTLDITTPSVFFLKSLILRESQQACEKCRDYITTFHVNTQTRVHSANLFSLQIGR